MRHPNAIAVLALAAGALFAGCGEEVEAIRGGDDAPAITAPNTTIPYETGGADGSGADGSERDDGRGGIAAGPDTVEPGDNPGGDEIIKPPRSEGGR